MSHPFKIVSRSFVVTYSLVVFLQSGSYSRLLDPPMSIRIDDQIIMMPFTGGLNQPDPQFLDWTGDGILDCFINDRDGRLQYWEGLADWQFGDRPLFMLVTKSFQDLQVLPIQILILLFCIHKHLKYLQIFDQTNLLK